MEDKSTKQPLPPRSWEPECLVSSGTVGVMIPFPRAALGTRHSEVFTRTHLLALSLWVTAGYRCEGCMFWASGCSHYRGPWVEVITLVC